MKKTFFFLTILFSTISLFADPVDREQAYKNAQKFLKNNGSGAKLKRPLVSRGETSQQPYYIFNAEDNQGFVVASGDDRTAQILGFGNSGNIDVANMPINMKEWLSNYAKQIEALGDSKITTSTIAGSGKSNIEPLIKTTWDQDSPYNNSINLTVPGLDGNPYTGCTATALAQIIGYHKHPTETKAEIPAFISDTHNISVPAVPAGSIIDWDNMLDAYADESSTATQKKAVADLMMYCSYALGSDYDKDGTGAYTNGIPPILTDIFDYDPTAMWKSSENYTIESWHNIVYSELAAQRPVLYAGYSIGGGHAFIIDGYRTDGYYHFNWGWGGYCDNYFLLHIANPYNTEGAGASSTTDGYSYGQEAIVGIQHGKDNTDRTHLDAYLDGFGKDDNGVYFKILAQNVLDKTKSYNLAIAYKDASNNTHVVWSYNMSDLQFGYVYGLEIPISYFVEIPTGTHTLFAISKADGTDEWYRSGDLPSQTVVLTVAANGTKTFSQPAFAKPNVVLTFPDDKVVDTKIPVGIKVTANNQEYRGPIFLFASKATNIPEEAKDQVGVELVQEASEEIELSFKPKQTGTWNIWITDNTPTEDNDGNIYLDDKYILAQTSITVTNGTGIENVQVLSDKKTVQNDNNTYNIAGQKISRNYKGIVVKDGKKIVFVK